MSRAPHISISHQDSVWGISARVAVLAVPAKALLPRDRIGGQSWRDLLTERAHLIKALAVSGMILPDVVPDAQLVRPPVNREVEALVVHRSRKCWLVG